MVSGDHNRAGSSGLSGSSGASSASGEGIPLPQAAAPGPTGLNALKRGRLAKRDAPGKKASGKGEGGDQKKEARKEESCEDRCTRTRLTSAALELLWSCSYGATSVDAICEKAGARKGSFYYFFPSKSALAIEALEEHWRRRSIVLNELFAPSTAPLERLKRYFGEVRRQQARHRDTHGMVLGCPLFSIGCEICTQDRSIGDKVQELNTLRGRGGNSRRGAKSSASPQPSQPSPTDTVTETVETQTIP